MGTLDLVYLGLKSLSTPVPTIWLIFCTINCDTSVSNYQLSHIGSGPGFEPLK